jgi:hypothetical protein
MHLNVIFIHTLAGFFINRANLYYCDGARAHLHKNILSHLYPMHVFFSHGTTGLTEPGPPLFRGSAIILRYTTLGRTPLGEGSTRHRDLYLTTHNNHKRQTSMPPVSFEPTIPASERSQTHALDRAATRIGPMHMYTSIIFTKLILHAVCAK